MRFILLVLALLVSFGTKEASLDPLPYRPKIEVVSKSGPHNDLSLLRTSFRNKVILLIKNCHDKYNIDLRVYETYRDSVRQDSLARNGKKVTNLTGGQSRHQWGLAVDLRGPKNKREWLLVGKEGESLGLRWGGRWRNPVDCYHFEEKILTEDLYASRNLFKTDTVLIPI